MNCLAFIVAMGYTPMRAEDTPILAGVEIGLNLDSLGFGERPRVYHVKLTPTGLDKVLSAFPWLDITRPGYATKKESDDANENETPNPETHLNQTDEI